MHGAIVAVGPRDGDLPISSNENFSIADAWLRSPNSEGRPRRRELEAAGLIALLAVIQRARSYSAARRRHTKPPTPVIDPLEQDRNPVALSGSLAGGRRNIKPGCPIFCARPKKRNKPGIA